jgi:hypothetical protein
MFKQVNRLSLIAGDLRGARVLGSLFNVHVEERIFFDEIDCLRVAHDSPGPSALGKWDHRKSLCLGVQMGGAGRPSMLWLPSQLRPGVSAFHNPRTQRPLDLSQESVPIAFVSADVSIATLGSEAAAGVCRRSRMQPLPARSPQRQSAESRRHHRGRWLLPLGG